MKEIRNLTDEELINLLGRSVEPSKMKDEYYSYREIEKEIHRRELWTKR